MDWFKKRGSLVIKLQQAWESKGNGDVALWEIGSGKQEARSWSSREDGASCSSGNLLHASLSLH